MELNVTYLAWASSRDMPQSSPCTSLYCTYPAVKLLAGPCGNWSDKIWQISHLWKSFAKECKCYAKPVGIYIYIVTYHSKRIIIDNYTWMHEANSWYLFIPTQTSDLQISLQLIAAALAAKSVRLVLCMWNGCVRSSWAGWWNVKFHSCAQKRQWLAEQLVCSCLYFVYGGSPNSWCPRASPEHPWVNPQLCTVYHLLGVSSCILYGHSG